MATGVLIIALGSPNYGRMAFTLALSLKHLAPSLSICLVHDETSLQHLSAQHLAFFDVLMPCPSFAIHNAEGKKEWHKVKTQLYALSPYEKTLFLDADTIWLPKHSALEYINSLQNIPFTCQNYAEFCLQTQRTTPSTKYTFWASLPELAAAENWQQLGHQKIYQQSSTLMYFEKGAKVEAFFKAVEAVYQNPAYPPFLENWRGGIPDEFCFNVAGMQQQIYPHATPYTPVLFSFVDKTIYSRTQIFNKFLAITPAEKNQQDIVIYNDLSKFYSRAAGLHNPFQWREKYTF